MLSANTCRNLRESPQVVPAPLTATSSRVAHSPLSRRIHRLTRSPPAAQGTSLRIELPLPHLLSDRPQHVLSDVGRVGILQTILPSETVHPRRVQPDKLLPRQPDPQADTLLSVIHSSSEHRTDQYSSTSRSFSREFQLHANFSSRMFFFERRGEKRRVYGDSL